jgi:phosphatidylserine/phosphatidylglycerophosphate/cardiolipin synthase-like enzyme
MSEALPPWLDVRTRRVIYPFVATLARSHKWKTLYLISPWISSFDEDAGMTFPQLLKRLMDDDATAYVVTRTPTELWHWEAVARLAETGKASIKFMDALHTKIFGAITAQGEFVLVGSANFTQRSLANRELGMFVRGLGEGRPLVRMLNREAAEIYRAPGSTTHCYRKL